MKIALDSTSNWGDLGEIVHVVDGRMRGISACRGRDGLLYVTSGKYVSPTSVYGFIDKCHDALKELLDAPKRLFHNNQVIPCFHGKITINESADVGTHWAFSHQGDTNILVQSPVGTDYTHPDVIWFLSKQLKQIMYQVAPVVLLPFAQQVTDRLKNQLGEHVPAGFKVGYGMNTLGKCNRKREISLSSNLLFVPDEEIVEYVVCHELAHLFVFNHSPQFHKCCDSLLDGREKKLQARLKTFEWPILTSSRRVVAICKKNH